MLDPARVRRFWRRLVVMLLVLSAIVFARPTQAASVVDVGTDARFEPAVAFAGMKHPSDFRYAGLYVSTPIDSSRQPVLFVHGADGTPRDLEALAADLDPTRQQAWFAYYATGNSIDASGHALAEEIVATMRRHGLTSITVVAHSMGGLVAWRAITELEEQVTVTRFVSINTPWGGIPAARFGALLSPSPLPIWRDLAPGSRALNAIHGERVRAPWTLVYTVQEDNLRSTGDGTVSRWSQVPPAARTQATTVVREIGTHMTALQEPQARRISALLALYVFGGATTRTVRASCARRARACRGRRSASHRRTGGRHQEEGMTMSPNQALWEKGDFTRIADTMRESGAKLVASLDVKPGVEVLDLGCGDGTTAVPLAEAGADVTGIDIARNLVAAGNARAEALGLSSRLRFQEGDACELVGVADGSFDLALSIFGAMFAPRPFDVARELVRVTKPGGRIVMGNWIPNDPTSFVSQVLKISSAFTPPPPEGFVSPMTWGVESHIVERFEKAGVPADRIAMQRDTFLFESPSMTAEEQIDLFRRFYGPTMNAFEAAEKSGQVDVLHRELVALARSQNRSTTGISIPATFMRVTVRR